MIFCANISKGVCVYVSLFLQNHAAMHTKGYDKSDCLLSAALQL